jgi:hypothetical protein
MKLTPLTPTSGDTIVTLTEKILLVLLQSGGIAMSSGAGPPNSGATAFTPSGVTMYKYLDVTNPDAPHEWTWTPATGWF